MNLFGSSIDESTMHWTHLPCLVLSLTWLLNGPNNADTKRRTTYLHHSRGGPCFILEEHLVEDLVLGGKQALVGRDLHAAHEEVEVLGQARVGQEEVGEISCHIGVLL